MTKPVRLPPPPPDPGVRRIRALGLDCYVKGGCAQQWLLPVCAATPSLRDRLAKLSPRNPGNWETAEIDTVPTICYRFTGKQLKDWKGKRLTSVWPAFCDRLGPAVAKAFWPDLAIRYNNVKAKARNTWEKHHGGYRTDTFNRGMSTRAAAALSIY